MASYVIVYLVAAPIILSWLIFKEYRKVCEVTKKYENLEKILLDIRDNKKTFFQERRRAVRVHREMDAKLIKMKVEENMKILNIGKGGALLRTSHNLEAGEGIEMKAYLPLFAQPIDIGANVVRVNRYNIDGSTPIFDAGVEFKKIEPLDREMLEETIDVLTAGSLVAS